MAATLLFASTALPAFACHRTSPWTTSAHTQSLAPARRAGDDVSRAERVVAVVVHGPDVRLHEALEKIRDDGQVVPRVDKHGPDERLDHVGERLGRARRQRPVRLVRRRGRRAGLGGLLPQVRHFLLKGLDVPRDRRVGGQQLPVQAELDAQAAEKLVAADGHFALRQRLRAGVRARAKEVVHDDHVEQRVAEKLERLVAGNLLGLVRRVREGAAEEQRRAEPIADNRGDSVYRGSDADAAGAQMPGGHGKRGVVVGKGCHFVVVIVDHLGDCLDRLIRVPPPLLDAAHVGGADDGFTDIGNSLVPQLLHHRCLCRLAPYQGQVGIPCASVKPVGANVALQTQVQSGVEQVFIAKQQHSLYVMLKLGGSRVARVQGNRRGHFEKAIAQKL
ncbi:hypothetical protein CRV24_009593 [Beauveria bassiana]|nr:hypothetical protein CRV24_009593 [Beauveria bassiana]